VDGALINANIDIGDRDNGGGTVAHPRWFFPRRELGALHGARRSQVHCSPLPYVSFITGDSKFLVTCARADERRSHNSPADIARTHYVVEDVARLREVLIDVILEVHGPLGLQEFLQEYAKRVRR
jgi:hypothetical protein